MKALVTGATGLVGQHLTRLLLQQQVFTVALGRDQEKLAKLEELGADTLEFDITSDFSGFGRLKPYTGNDFIWFHCAAAITGAPPETLFKVNVKGTQKLVRIAEMNGIDKFILASSIATYGLAHDEPMEEEAPLDPESEYGMTKLEQERIVQNSSLNWIILRPPYITGPFDENFMEEFTERIKNKKMPSFTKKGKIGIIDARDLARAMLDLTESETHVSKIYNIQSTAIYTDEFVNLLGSKLGIDAPFGPQYPYRLSLLVGFIYEVYAKLRGKSAARGISRYRIRALTTDRTLNTRKIEEEAGFLPRYSIEQSIDDWIANHDNNSV